MKKKRGPLVRVYDYDADTLLLFFLCPPTNKLTNENNNNSINPSSFFKLLSLSLSLFFLYIKSEE